MSGWGSNQQGWSGGAPPPQQQQPGNWNGGGAMPPQQGYNHGGAPAGGWGGPQGGPPQQAAGGYGPPQGGWGPQQHQAGGYGQQGQAGWGHQQGAYGQPGYAEGSSCCATNPQQQQQSMLCPADPNQPCCNTNPNEPGMFQGCMQCCDATMWAIGFFVIVTIVCFGVVLGTTTFDNLFAVYGVSTTAQLDRAILPDIIINMPAATTVAPASTLSNMTAAPAAPSPYFCRTTDACTTWGYSYSGSFGTMCMEDSLTAAAMVMSISRWVVFRDTLFFIAMMGTLVILFIAAAVHRHKNPPQFGVGANNGVPPPTSVFGTPLYYMFRGAWATVSLVIFFWVCTELFQYWSFNGFYLSNTQGRLHTFWVLFNEKFLWCVITVTIYLCWPLMHIALEIGFFIAGIIPWCAFRSMCYNQLTIPRDPEVREDDQSCCVRLDNFYTESFQLRRLGFSDGQWRLMTGHREPFFQGFDQQGPPPVGGYGGQPGGMSAGGGMAMGAPPGPQAMMPRPIPPPGGQPPMQQQPSQGVWGSAPAQADSPARQSTFVNQSQSGFFPTQSSEFQRSQGISDQDESDMDASGRKKKKKDKKKDKSEKKEKRDKRAE